MLSALTLAALSLWTANHASASTLSPDPSQATYNDVKAFMRELVAKYPSNVQLFTLGASDSGETIEGLKIGNGSIKNLVVSTHHGNEYGSTELARGFAAELAANPIKSQTVFVIPVLNIGGYNRKARWETGGSNTFDPNRNYPGPCGTEGPFTLKSTAALAAFVEKEQIVSSATLHTFSPAVVYPWGISSHDLSTPYDLQFKAMCDDAVIESHYQTGNSTEVIYAADGTYEDYAFWKHGIWSILFEVGHSHNPSVGDVAETVRVNVPGMRRMLERAPQNRATDHEFHGKCDRFRALFDRHDE